MCCLHAIGVIGPTGSFDSGVLLLLSFTWFRVLYVMRSLVWSVCLVRNLGCDSFIVYVAAVLVHQISAIVLDFILLSLQFSKDGWGGIVCATGINAEIFVISCLRVITLVEKDIITAVVHIWPNHPRFFSFFLLLSSYNVLDIVIANGHSARFPTGVTGLFAIDGGNSPSCVATYAKKVLQQV